MCKKKLRKRARDIPTMMTFSLESFFSTSALISSKPQIRLPGTWFSELPEYHRTAPALRLWPLPQAVGSSEGAVQAIAGAAVLAAATTVAGAAAAAVIREAMRRSASRWQACRVAMIARVSRFTFPFLRAS